MNLLLHNPLVWLLPVGLPLLTAAFLLPHRWRSAAQRLAPWTALPALLLAVAVSEGRVVDVPWLLLGSRLGLDETSRVFLLFTALLWLLSGIFAAGYLAQDPRRHRFTFYFLFALAGNLGLILARDMISFYVGFALMSFAAYGLVVHDGDPAARRAGRVYIVLVIVGEVLLFSGLVAGAWSTGSILWEGFGHRLADSPAQQAVMWLLLLGLGVKAGALPLHVWLPVAHPAAPVPASAVLSGAMIKAGLIGWLHLAPAQPAVFWGQLYLVLGLSAAFYAAVVGTLQTNPKTVLAYSSISQMGLMTIGVGAVLLASPGSQAAVVAVLLYAMHHALAKGALFLGTGVAHVTRGPAWQRWLCGLGLLLPSLSLAGMPLTSGALAKAVLKAGTADIAGVWHEVLVVALPAAAVATTVILARFLWLAWPTAAAAGETSAPPRPVVLSWAVLLVAVAGCAIAWPWGPDVTASKLLLDPQKVLATLWPVVVGAAMAAVVAVASVRGVRGWTPTVPAGDILWIFQAAGLRLARLGLHVAGAGGTRLTTRLRQRDVMYPAISRLVALCGSPEAAMRSGPVAGVLLLMLAGLLLVLLALPTG
jgi:formate hydrogenlyase subunit 3/multisubunit Na+/H+ antiporter MnhD subunit